MNTSLILGGLALANLSLSLVSQWYVVTQLGLGMETDAFFASMLIPQLIMNVVNSSLVNVLVPLLSVNEGNTLRQTIWSFFVGVSLLFIAFAIILQITSQYWVSLILPGFSAEGKLLTQRLVSIQLINMVFTANVSVLWSAHYAQHKFIWTESSEIIATIIGTIFLVWALPDYGIMSAAWSLLLISILKVFFLCSILGTWQKPVLNSPEMKKAWQRIIPLLLGTMYYKTDLIFDKILASFAPVGGLTMLDIAKRIYSIGNRILQKSICAPLIPRLSKYWQQQELLLLKKTYLRKLSLILGLTMVGILMLILVGQPVFQLFIGHGGVTEKDIQTIWWLMLGLMGFFVGGSMGNLSSTSFYAVGNTKTPTQISLINYSVYIPIKIILFNLFSLMGMAIATSIYYMSSLIWQIISFQRQYLSQK